MVFFSTYVQETYVVQYIGKVSGNKKTVGLNNDGLDQFGTLWHVEERRTKIYNSNRCN